MIIKSDIELVTGFLGSGKTSFINALLENTLIEKEKVVVIQCEKGETKIEDKFQNNNMVIVTEYIPEKPLTKGFIKHIAELHRPHRIIMEYNGTKTISELLDILSSNELKTICKLTTSFHILDAATFELYLNNMGNMLLPFIKLSNLILINGVDSIGKNQLNNIRVKINKLNPYAHIIESRNNGDIKEVIHKTKIMDNGILKKFRIGFKSIAFK